MTPQLSQCNIHIQSRVTLLRQLRSTIPRSRIFPKTSLFILEAVKTTCALLLILSIQRYLDNFECKNRFPAPSKCHFSSPFSFHLLCIFFLLYTHIISFYFEGRINTKKKEKYQQKLSKIAKHNQQLYNKTVVCERKSMNTQLQEVHDSNIVDQRVKKQNKHAEFLSSSIQACCAWRRLCSGSFSNTKTCSFTEDNDSTSLEIFTAYYDFANSLIHYMYFQNHEIIRSSRDCNLPLAPSHSSSLEIPNTHHSNRGPWRNFLLNG